MVLKNPLFSNKPIYKSPGILWDSAAADSAQCCQLFLCPQWRRSRTHDNVIVLSQGWVSWSSGCILSSNSLQNRDTIFAL